jgi:hypothetical protein
MISITAITGSLALLGAPRCARHASRVEASVEAFFIFKAEFNVQEKQIFDESSSKVSNKEK